MLHRMRLMYLVYAALQKGVIREAIADEYTLLQRFLVPVPANTEDTDSSGVKTIRPNSFKLQYYKATKEVLTLSL